MISCMGSLALSLAVIPCQLSQVCQQARWLTSQPLSWPKLLLRSFLSSCSAASEVLASKAASAPDVFGHSWSGLLKGRSLPDALGSGA